MKLKKITAISLVLALFTASSAMGETAADVIMNIGTTQAFTDEAVSDEDLTVILEAGLAAASAINQQPWYFVALKNQELMDEIAGSGMSFGPPAGAGQGAEGAPKDAPEGGEVPASPEGGEAPAVPEGSEASAAPEESDAPAFPAAPAASGSAKAGLGDSPVAIIVFRNDGSKSPNADFDCGLATQNMAIAAASLGYGVKIVSSPTMALNGQNHDALCEKLGVDPAMQAVAVVLIGYADSEVDASSSASTRESLEEKTNIIE